MTAPELSHPAVAATFPGRSLSTMVYAVLLRLDASGARPLVLREDSPPLGSEKGVLYRFIAQTDDHGEAVRVAQQLQRPHHEYASPA